MEIHDIINLPYEKFVDSLKDLADDPKIHAVLKAGREDGLPEDEKIQFGSGTRQANQLIPLQKELLLEKSVKWSLTKDGYKATKELLSGLPVAVDGKAVVTLNGKYIIDGHHRWVQAYSINPNAKLYIHDMKLNIKPIDALKIMQVAIAAAIKDIPFSLSNGTDLYTASQNTIKEYIETTISDEVVILLGQPKNTAVQRVCDNILQLKRMNPPEPNAPTRILMPQPSFVDDFDKLMKSGEVNFKKPFVTEHFIPSFDEYINKIK